MDLEDGELRYFRVGPFELIRRVYFSVRDEAWRTVVPEILGLKVSQKLDGFTVDYQGRCRTATLDFEYQIQVVATLPGLITVSAAGRPLRPSLANRFGFCVLLGAQAVCGREFEVDLPQRKALVFPYKLEQVVFAQNFKALKYENSGGMTAEIELSKSDFGLEDQRFFGDSSFKLFSGMRYLYPQVSELTEKKQVLRLTVDYTSPPPQATKDPLEVTIGNSSQTPSLFMPSLHKLLAARRPQFFLDGWTHRESWAAQSVVSWDFDPSVNLYDQKTFAENLDALRDQADTVRDLAPGASLALGVVSYRTNDSLAADPFQNAWVLAAIATASRAGISEISFGSLSQESSLLLVELGNFAGVPLLPIKMSCEATQSGERKYACIAIEQDSQILVYLANLTELPTDLLVTVSGGKTHTCHLVAYQVGRWEL